ncbi:MAG: WD40 repeat domain-containing protein, partial [Actinobacteria bacterium]
APWLRRRSRGPASGQLVRTLAGHAGEVTGVRYSPSGQRVFTVGDDGSLRVWDGGSGRLIATLLEQEANLLCCDLRGDGRVVVVGDIDGRVLVLDAHSGVQIAFFSPSAAPVRSCSHSPAESLIAVGTADGGLSTWDPLSGRQLASFEGHRGGTLGCAFGPTGATVASVGVDGWLAIHDVRGGTVARERAGQGAPLYCCAVAPSGELMATGGEDGILRIWDGRSGSVVQALEGDSPLLSCRFGPRGRLLATGDQDGTLRLWQMGTSRPPAAFSGHMAWINACDFVPDESGIVTASADETAKVWSLPALEDAVEEPLDLEKQRGGFRRVGAGPAVDADETQGPNGEDRPSGGILDCAFSDDGALLVTVGFDGRVRVRSAASGEHCRDLARSRGSRHRMCLRAGGEEADQQRQRRLRDGVGPADGNGRGACPPSRAGLRLRSER